MERDDRGELLLAAEPAARLRLDDPRLSVVDAEAALERGVDVVRALERAVDGHAAVLARDRDHRVVLDVELLLVADPVLALEDEVGGRERGIRVARRELVRGEDVVGRERIEDRGERRGPDGDGMARRAQDARGRGGEQGQRLGVVLDLAADRDEDRLVGLDRADDVVAGDVGRGDDHDRRPVERRGRGRGRRSGRARRSSGSSPRTRRPGRPGRRRTWRRRSAWPAPRDGAAARRGHVPARSCRARSTTAPAGSVRVVNSGKGRPPWRLTLSPAEGRQSPCAPLRTASSQTAPRVARLQREPSRRGRGNRTIRPVPPVSSAVHGTFIRPSVIHPTHPYRSTDMNDNTIILLGFLVAANIILITFAVIRSMLPQERRDRTSRLDPAASCAGRSPSVSRRRIAAPLGERADVQPDGLADRPAASSRSGTGSWPTRMPG